MMQDQQGTKNSKLVKAAMIGFAVLVLVMAVVSFILSGRPESKTANDQQQGQKAEDNTKEPENTKKDTHVKLADTNIYVPNPENRPMKFQKSSQYGYIALFSDVEGCGDYSFANIEVFNNESEVHAAYSQSPGTAEDVISRAVKFKGGKLLSFKPPQSACRAISAEDVNTGSDRLKKYNATISYTLKQLENTELR